MTTPRTLEEQLEALKLAHRQKMSEARLIEVQKNKIQVMLNLERLEKEELDALAAIESFNSEDK